MRVTSELWVSALVRRIFADGGYAAIVKRGATEAGAVFIVSRNRFGEISLFGPASQTAYDSERPDDRRFSQIVATTDATAVDEKLAREQRFDPDVWIVELEPGQTDVGEFVPLAKT
jgi:hypothetical protein